MKKIKNKNLFLYGRHVCRAVLNNSNRKIHKVMVSKDKIEEYKPYLKNVEEEKINIVSKDKLEEIAESSFNQGIVISVDKLKQKTLKEYIDDIKNLNSLVLILDKVYDPQNIGAIIRSAYIFGCKLVINLEKNTPEESTTLLKASSGAFEQVPYISVKNLKQTIRLLKEEGFWVVGLSSNTTKKMKSLPTFDKTVLVMGAEDKGLRDQTLKCCDIVATIPTFADKDIVDSLNVSNAAAISLYELSQKIYNSTDS